MPKSPEPIIAAVAKTYVVEWWRGPGGFNYSKRRQVVSPERGRQLLATYRERGLEARLWALWPEHQFEILAVNWPLLDPPIPVAD